MHVHCGCACRRSGLQVESRGWQRSATVTLYGADSDQGYLLLITVLTNGMKLVDKSLSTWLLETRVLKDEFKPGINMLGIT